ncbi:AbrB/MazE/SpoVT family DNA-binding domain-containing protein [Candidatus Babeliales bacterium]|nr:AbrB/MazE/SpoVT family DNA-binding domain-containing protein [Candidatus Babeliales bacterium]
MLKKLVKYGNSNALVFDRAILELLNISEGSILKLRIEGDVLIIKASEKAKPTDSIVLDVENIHNRIESITGSASPMKGLMEGQMRQFCQTVEKNPDSMNMLKEFLALRLKYVPELAKMDKEMKEAAIALGYPFYSNVVDGKIKQ